MAAAASAFNVSIVFKTDIEAAQAGIAKVKAELGAVAPVTGQATAATTAHVVALEKDAAAADRAAKAQASLAAEARKAQEQLKRTGTAPATLPSYSAIPDPAPKKVPVGVPANTPAPQPSSAPVPGMSEQEKQSIRDRFVPLHAATRDYQSQLEELKRAKAEGVLTDKQVETAQSQITKAYEKTSEAVRREQAILEDSNRVIRLQAYERRNLNYQISDTVQTLALGMPPQMVLLQQGPQIIDIYGGVGNTMRAAAQAFTLTRIAVAGAAGAALLGIKAYSDYLASTKEVETAAHGLGRSVAGSASEMEAAAQAGAAAAGISVSAARSMQAAFLRTGKIAHQNYAGIIAISKDFAATMGIDADAAGDALAKMFSDPAKAAADLGTNYGMLDAATIERIRNLTAQNRLQEAQAALLDGMKGKLASSTEAVTGLGRAWNFVATGASNAMDWMGRAVDRAFDGPDLETQIVEQTARVERARQMAERGPVSGISRAQAGNLAQEETRLAALQTRQQELADEAAGKAQIQRGNVAWDIAKGSGANTSAQRIQDLRNEVVALQGGLSDRNGPMTQQQSTISETIAIRTRQIDALVNSQQRTAELDQLDIRIQTERNPLIRANLEAERTRLQMQEEDVSSGKIEIDAKRAYTRVMEEAVVTAQESAVQMAEEIDVRNRLSVLVASGVVKSEDANRLLRDELTLRPLIAAAAAAEGEQKTQLLSTIDQLRAAMDRQAASEKALESATAARQKLKDQTRTLDQLRLEQSLIGQTEQTRQRVLAQATAEADIRQAGIGVTDTLARQIRGAARETADLTLEVNRQADAWDKVRGASEGAIDAMIDGALSGNLKDGMQGIVDEVKGLWSDLALKNPLKNAMLGTNYATLDDAGGIGGIWNRLMGGPEPLSVTASSKSMTTPMMTVQAGTVTIAGGAAGLLGMTGGLNTFGGTLGGSADVQKQVWDFLDGKGLKDFQIAGIMGNVQGESGFDPFAKGDGQTSFGLFQHHAERGADLLSSVGGNLGDVQGQLEFMWRELMTSESGAMRQLLGSRNVGEATTAFMTGFERPADMSSLNTRLAAADQALATFGSTTTQATQGLGTLGTGFDTFGTSLAQLISGGAVTGQSLLSSGLSMAGTLVASLPGFSVGGETGGNDPSKIAGVVHQKEFVFDAAATSRIGPANLEALRRGKLAGYLTGGYVSSAPVPSATASAAPTAPAPVIQFIDQTSGQHTVQTEEYTDARGQRQQRYVLSDAVGDGLSAPGGKAQRALRTSFGVSRPGRSRP